MPLRCKVFARLNDCWNWDEVDLTFVQTQKSQSLYWVKKSSAAKNEIHTNTPEVIKKPAELPTSLQGRETALNTMKSKSVFGDYAERLYPINW